MLDLSSLQKALATLDETIQRATDSSLMGGLDKVTQNAVRAGVIQHFEFTYELCWKFIQRWIRLNRTPEDAEPRARKELFRLAAEYGLIEDPVPWFDYAEARNLTSHTYDEVKAERVYEASLRFLPDARYLLEKLEQNNG
ncbi:MAG: nucleotidyltransferase substrate binding protein [Candidatus Omnitrophica bacterium]|nr:nucleotidyltransferase substrate binding protein [Candidatus Omnitrophota bacterium]